MRFAALTTSLAVMILGANDAMADRSLNCRFVTECLETESCAATDYSVTVTYRIPVDVKDGLDARAKWSDDTADHGMAFFKGPEVSTGSWSEPESKQWGRLLLNAQGQARYVYMSGNGPMVIAYHGTCEAAE